MPGPGVARAIMQGQFGLWAVGSGRVGLCLFEESLLPGRVVPVRECLLPQIPWWTAQLPG